MEPIAHFSEVIELLAEFLVYCAVWHIATGWNVEIVNGDAVLKLSGDVSRMTEIGEILHTSLFHRKL